MTDDPRPITDPRSLKPGTVVCRPSTGAELTLLYRRTDGRWEVDGGGAPVSDEGLMANWLLVSTPDPDLTPITDSRSLKPGTVIRGYGTRLTFTLQYRLLRKELVGWMTSGGPIGDEDIIDHFGVVTNLLLPADDTADDDDDQDEGPVEGDATDYLTDADLARIICPDSPLDVGIARTVWKLREAGVETFESCEGTEGHTHREPTVRFYGGAGAGWHALSVCYNHDLPVKALRHVWQLEDGVPAGPFWELVFTPTR